MVSPDVVDDRVDADLSDEQLARVVLRVLAGFIAVLLAGGIASAAGRLAEGETGDETAGDVVVDGGGSLSPRGGIGPLPGTAVSTYLRARVAALAEVGDGERRAAVVSFADYRTVAAARDVVPAGVELEALLLALPGGRPSESSPNADPSAVVARQREEAASEKAALEELLPTVTDDDFHRQYQADIDRLSALLEAPKAPGPIVHAVVVVGPGAALRRLASATGVRLVDVGRTDRPPTAGAAVGLRPEETIRAGVPPTRPAA